MKRFAQRRSPALRLVLMLALAAVLCPGPRPARADAGGFGTAELKRMGTFLSNFTELGFLDFDVEKSGGDETLHLGAPENAADLIRFGIRHNYVNNFKSRIKPCPVKGCKHGSLVMDAKFAAESVRKYFDLDLKHRSVADADPPFHFDGKLYHFEGADGEATYYAEVKRAVREGGVIRMTGEIYNAEDKNDRPFTFVAAAKPHKWNGKDTWAILSMKTKER